MLLTTLSRLQLKAQQQLCYNNKFVPPPHIIFYVFLGCPYYTNTHHHIIIDIFLLMEDTQLRSRQLKGRFYHIFCNI
jgi:hypothetical protein